MRIFSGDGRASWLEEGLANARALERSDNYVRYDPKLTDAMAKDFRDFSQRWMKTQPSGYSDFDKYLGNYRRNNGLRSITSKLLELSSQVKRYQSVNSGSLHLYFQAEYSRVPVIRIHDHPGIRWGRLFPKAHGIQVKVYSREHPPAHIHVFFSESDSVRVDWPALQPLPRERRLTGSDQKNLDNYLRVYYNEIDKRVGMVF